MPASNSAQPAHSSSLIARKTPDSGSPPALLLDIGDVAAALAIGTRTLRRWVSSGAFPRPDLSIGAKVRRWKRGTVERWIDAQAGGQRAEA